MNVDVVSLRMVRDRSIPYGWQRINCAEDVYELWCALHANGMPDREEVWVVCLDTKNKPAAVHQLSMGTADQAICLPRDVLKIALMANATRVILMHNHPSGDPEPSADDLKFTQGVKAAGETMQVQVLDHVVIGDGSWRSILEQ